ncbi:MAG TPA: ATP-dependent RNA helicase HrpA, partial [Smithellaceae bacterium]|nr:ATP-dependent RNA helicase HrpA [Smithellaceae bacterium]
VQNGICIRLYSAQDYAQRHQYTVPEILRSNLASVILRLLALQLGSINSFPFIDRPHPKSIRDGIEILRDLGALVKDENAENPDAYTLTQTGREMARFPLDPRISRILIEAQKENCVNEITIIAAALSIQDPRERPYEKTQQAAMAHGRFQNNESDFLAYLNIWNHYHQNLEKLKTQSQMRKFCLEHFLSYRRMAEWRDIYNQIIDIINPAKKSGKKQLKPDINQDTYDKIHRCILSGYLSNIAQKKEKNFYQAAKGREVMIFPGSGLFNKGGNWIFAAEITQTSRLFARTVANIKPEWLEELGKDNCRHTYSAAHWEKNRGQVVASEKVTLFGLTIVEKRSVAYDKINPETARYIFIREALLTGEVARPLPFLQHNLELWENARTAEEKLRKRGFAADEDTVARLYEQKLPVLSDIRSLLKFIKDKGGDSFLRFREEDFIVERPDPEEISQYPDQIKIGDASLTSHYRFSPGKNDDGVTVKVPLGLVKSAAETDIASHLPGLLREKIIHLIKALPKSLRLKLPAPAKIAVLFLEWKTATTNHLPQELSRFIREKFGVVVPLESWNLQTVPSYLSVRYSVINEDGKEIKTSRDINELNQEFSGKININALKELRSQWEKEGITGWDFGDLPDKIPLQGNYGLLGYAYPALVPREESVDLRLFTDGKESISSHLSGCRALYCLHFADKIKQLKKQIALSNELKTMAVKIGSSKTLEQSILNKVILDLFSAAPRNKFNFIKYAESVKAGILIHGQTVLNNVKPVLTAFAETSDYLRKLNLKNAGNAPALKLIEDIKAELRILVPPDFPEKYPAIRLKEIPRYLRAASIRAERGCLNLTAAERKRRDVDIYTRRLEKLRTVVLPFASEEKKNKIEEFAWMIEEYKVSLFAQELKTPYPVSPKKLNQLLKEIEETI